MEIDLKDLMDKSTITTSDLDYIIERLMRDGTCCTELVGAFIEAYKHARTIRDINHGDKPYLKTNLQTAELIYKWVSAYMHNEEDKYSGDYP